MLPARSLVTSTCTLVALVLNSGCHRTAPAPKSVATGARGTAGVQSSASPAGTPGPAATHARPHLYSRVVVLSVGVSDYRSTSIPALSYAASDAEAVAERLRNLYGYEAELLVGPRATKRAIEAALGRYGEQLGDRDALIVFFAGHGQVIDLPSSGRAGYLIPHDADLDLHDTSDPERWSAQALDVHWLVQRVREMKAQHVLLVADACFSGFMTSRGNLEDRIDLRALPREPSRAVLTATSTNQEAGEDPERGRGYFTAALLDQLEVLSKNRDAASVTDLFVEVRKRVGKATGTRGEKPMTPQLSRVGDGEFVFFPRSIPPEAAAEAGLDGGAINVNHDLLAGIVERSLGRTARRSTLAQAVEAFQSPAYHFAVDAKQKSDEWEAKRRRFEENASLGDPLAMAGMHFCAARGLGGEIDPASAYRYANDAYQADPESGLGHFLLGRCYEHGWGVTRNEATADELYRQSADRGSVLGEYARAMSVLRATADVGEALAAAEALDRAGRAGVADAYASLADAYAYGDRPGIGRDVPKAVDYFTRALELGSADAALGLFFLSMEPPGRDVERAAASLRRAADAGVAGAQYHLAVRLFPWPAPSTGRFRRGTLGLPHDLVESKRLLDLSARQKFPAAVCLLAELYARKDFPGYQADPQLARRYLEEAIALDVPRAYTLRGLWSLQDDPGVISVYPKDERAAFAAFRQGATLGDALACARLGDLYECGAGMDYPEREGSWRPIPPRYGSSKEPALPYYELSHLALHWYTKAMQRGGDEYAARRLIDFAGDVGLYRTDGPLPRPVPGDLTPGDVLLNWAKEDPLSQLAFYRLGFGLVPLLSKLRVKRLDGGDPRRIEQALVVLASINDDLNGQWSAARTRGRRELASQIGLAPPEIDPREIDPARGAELLGQLKEYAARMAGDGGLNEAEQAEWGGFIDTATQELLEGYDGFQDVIRKFPGWDDTPEWIRSAPKPSNAGRPAEPKIPGMIVPIP